MNRAETAIAKLLDGNNLILIDVGAAFGLPHHLSLLARQASVYFFEPDQDAARKVEENLRRRGLTNSHVLPFALAGSDGERTLHATNVPTGSSLLKPRDDGKMSFTPPEYFFPMQEIMVQTRRLDGVLDAAGLARADAIKLDTQGAELEILQGLGTRLSTSTLSVEMEIGFPGAYMNQPGFGDIDRLMTEAGFQLFDLRLSSFDRHYQGDWSYYRRKVFNISARSHSMTKRITEADGIYFRRSDLVLAEGKQETVRRQAVMLCVYGFFADAIHLVESAGQKGILTTAEKDVCRLAVLDWHAGSRDILCDARWFAALSGFARRVSRFFQRRLLGQHFYRWSE